METYLIATTKSWNIEHVHALKENDPYHEWHLVTKKEELTMERIKQINPRYIFFPHWSWVIPQEIYEHVECIVFHMTDLPYGRGGSPLQNLIVRGHTKTKISALRVVEALDAGDIYLKRNLTLDGNAEDIYRRASDIIYAMIQEIIRTKPLPTPQTGDVVAFERRKPKDGNLAHLDTKGKIYDYIRMLDAEGYPRAFLEAGNIRLEFDHAELKDDEVQANVRIIMKER